MGTILTDLGDVGYEHEGYLAAILTDGTESGSSWTGMPDVVGHRPACDGCEWRGTANYDHPGQRWLDEDAEEALMAEWVRHVHEMVGLAELEAKVQVVRSHGHRLVRAAREAIDAGIEWREIELALPFPLSGAVWRWLEANGGTDGRP
jgi:hypothetical protein